MSNEKHRKRACCKIAFGKNSSNIRERCRIQSAALLVCAYRESGNVDVILEKQLYSAEKVQNKPWRYSQRQMWNIFYFPALCRDFLRHTGLETAVFPLYPQLFQIKSYDQQKSKKFQKQTGRIENMTYGPEQPKQLCLHKTFWEKRAETTQRITFQRGIHLQTQIGRAHV